MIDVTSEETILSVKQKVEAQKPEFAADGQKLISQGKILSNDKTVGDFNIKDGDFLVVIPGKTAPKPAAETPAAAPATTTDSSSAAAPAATSGDAPAAGGDGAVAPPLAAP